jgi:hypothetical protein
MLSSSFILRGIARLFLIFRYLMQLMIMCWIEILVWHSSQVRGRSLLMRKEWVRNECPIMHLVIVTSYRLLR